MDRLSDGSVSLEVNATVATDHIRPTERSQLANVLGEDLITLGSREGHKLTCVVAPETLDNGVGSWNQCTEEVRFMRPRPDYDVYLKALDKAIRIRTAAVLRALVREATKRLRKIEGAENIIEAGLEFSTSQAGISQIIDRAGIAFDDKLALTPSSKENGNFTNAVAKILKGVRSDEKLSDFDKDTLEKIILEAAGVGVKYSE